MSAERKSPQALETSHGELVFGKRCLVMGILNVTPDSFSDGGRYVDAELAVRRALEIEAEGADLLDIGGESTRPGSAAVDPAEQIQRIVPVIRETRARGLRIPVSVDTRSATVARAALDAGADIVNDVSGLCDDVDMVKVVRERGVPFIVMHMKGTPVTMQADPQYSDVVREVREYFLARAEALDAAGVDPRRMIVDPGIGFGKTTAHNVELIQRIAELHDPSRRDTCRPFPILVGASRKRFIGELMGEADVVSGLAEHSVRDAGTAAVVAWCALAGVEMVRVHDVRTMRAIVDQVPSAAR